MSFDTVAKEAKKVVRRQGETFRETEKVIQNLLQQIEDAKARVQTGEMVDCVLQSLGEQMRGELRKAVTHTKDLHSAVGKLGKVRWFCEQDRSTIILRITCPYAKLAQSINFLLCPIIGIGEGHGHATGHLQGLKRRSHGPCNSQSGIHCQVVLLDCVLLCIIHIHIMIPDICELVF
jgi:hypothetical protein